MKRRGFLFSAFTAVALVATEIKFMPSAVVKVVKPAEKSGLQMLLDATSNPSAGGYMLPEEVMKDMVASLNERGIPADPNGNYQINTTEGHFTLSKELINES